MLGDCYIKNALLFPYGYEFAPILSGLIKNNRIDLSIKLISPEGWGINGMDAGQAFGRPYIGIKIMSDLENHMLDSNALIAVPFKDTGKEEINQLVGNLIDESIKLAKSMKKDVFDLRNIINETIQYNKVNDHNLEIECPVIFVNGITEQLNKLDVIIELAHSLSAKGYKVSKIGTRHYCNILDMHPFPQFMFSEMKERQKIQTFRAFALNIYKKERPDVFIIGIPGAAIPYNDKVDNGYGITNFLVSMAVRADFSITCSNLEFWDFEKLNVHFTHRFGHGIDCVVLSNTKILYNIQEFPDKIFYEIQDYTQIDKYKNKIEKENPSIPIYNIFNEKDMGSLTELVINELADV